ncbi:YbaK/EbsC family protein [Lentzea sp. NPDC004782]|uniref:YbaK/EbsC family protein n=1 Tax=Lentzea sp. NPDC004782 TaxID=3154458 RepID=UPI0033AEF95E
MSTDGFATILRLLDAHGVPYTVLHHAPEGNTERASRTRGHDLHAAAKCLVTEVRTKAGTSRFVLVVVEGHRKVDLKALKRLYRRKDASLAPPELAEEYGGAAVGSIPPFPLHDRLDVVVDVGLLDHEVIYFNAARLDRSVVLNVRDYVFIAGPRIARIASGS